MCDANESFQTSLTNSTNALDMFHDPWESFVPLPSEFKPTDVDAHYVSVLRMARPPRLRFPLLDPLQAGSSWVQSR